MGAKKNTSDVPSAKRRSNRKSRTKAPSPSPAPSSSSSASSGSSALEASSSPSGSPSLHSQEQEESPVSSSRPTATPESAFSDFYLRHVTTSLAADIDKLRSAKDFQGQRSVDILVTALRQGEVEFSLEERRKIGAAAMESQGKDE